MGTAALSLTFFPFLAAAGLVSGLFDLLQRRRQQGRNGYVGA
jgi:hypothetical protein